MDNIHQGSAILLIKTNLPIIRSPRKPSCAAGRAHPGACAVHRTRTVSPFSGRTKPLPPAAAREVYFLRVGNCPECGKRRQSSPVPCSLAAGRARVPPAKGMGFPFSLIRPAAVSKGMTPYRPPSSAPKPIAINSRPCAPTARGAGRCLCKRLPGHLCGYQVADPLCGILGNGGALALQHPLAV